MNDEYNKVELDKFADIFKYTQERLEVNEMMDFFLGTAVQNLILNDMKLPTFIEKMTKFYLEYEIFLKKIREENESME